MNMLDISEKFANLNVIEVTVSDNGMTGKDYKFSVMIGDLACTRMMVNGEHSNVAHLMFHGESEKQTFIQAMEFVIRNLKGETITTKHKQVCASGTGAKLSTEYYNHLDELHLYFDEDNYQSPVVSMDKEEFKKWSDMVIESME